MSKIKVYNIYCNLIFIVPLYLLITFPPSYDDESTFLFWWGLTEHDSLNQDPKQISKRLGFNIDSFYHDNGSIVEMGLGWDESRSLIKPQVRFIGR